MVDAHCQYLSFFQIPIKYVDLVLREKNDLLPLGYISSFTPWASIPLFSVMMNKKCLLHMSIRPLLLKEGESNDLKRILRLLNINNLSQIKVQHPVGEIFIIYSTVHTQCFNRTFFFICLKGKKIKFLLSIRVI